MQGAQASLLAGVIAVGIGLGGGLLLGLLAAARPGRLSAAIMRTADFMLAFPALLMAIMLTAVFGAGLTNAIVAVGIYNIPSFVRITRAAAAGVWSREYALAARGCGLSGWQITRRHVLPNILPLLLVQATVRFAVAILAEAALSFLGFGVQPPQPSWGRMLADAQPRAVRGAPAGPVARAGHHAGRAGPEPAGRWPARSAGPEVPGTNESMTHAGSPR